MNKKLIELLGLDEKATEDQIVAEVAALKTIVTTLKQKEEERTEMEKLVVEKMSKGLTRAQAITVIERQKAHDTAKARAEKIQAIVNAAKSPADAAAQIKKAFPDATEQELAVKATNAKK